MTFRFTLSYTPTLPPLDQFSTEPGDVAWDIDRTPSISLPGPDSSQIQADFVLIAGTYSIDYDIDISNTGIAVFNINFTKAGHTIIVATDSSGNLSGAGNFTGTLNFTLTETCEGMEISFANFAANTKVLTINSLALSGGQSQVISEPDGFIDGKLRMQRDKEFFSLVEHYEGAANGAFIFYGTNGVQDGGINFIRSMETAYGFDVNITILIEYAPDDLTYAALFSGLLDLTQKVEMKDNKMQVPVIRNSLWTKFINRFETPVNLSDLVDLDGNAVDPVEPVTVYLTSQRIRKTYHAYLSDFGLSYASFVTNDYYQFNFNDITLLDEIKEKFSILADSSSELPAGLFYLEEGGYYNFDCRIIGSRTDSGDLFAHSLKAGIDYIDFFVQFNDESPIAFAWEDLTIGSGTRTIFTFSGTYELRANTEIRIYGKANTTNTDDLNILGGETLSGYPDSSPYSTYLKVIADTTYPDTEAQGYLIHDLIHGVLARIGLGTDPFYSDFLGGFNTNARQYDADGCGWMYVILKGLQLRQYTLTEKPFSISMKDIWDGINPILNLGLGYETINGTEVIRIEQKRHFLGM